MGDADGLPNLQLVSGSGEFHRAALEDFARKEGLYEKGLSYAVVAIMGPQSSGKSTLLNAMFKTRFKMMDYLKGRGQTTQGIWLARDASGLETFTLVLDLEGTDGRERGEDDTAFEKQSTLFALATADVILVNMWCHDIGREHAANKPLLKTVFQVMMKLFSPRKATLLFVIRDKTKTPIEHLEPILREDLDKIWNSVPKPEEHRNSSISDFFHVEVTWLPNFEEKEDEFYERVELLRSRFQHSIAPGEIAGDRSGVVPASGLALSMQEIWRRIRDNKDLDLPAHKIMVATVRCEQIADERLDQFVKSEGWEALKTAVAAKPAAWEPLLSTSGPQIGQLAALALAGYDAEAAFFEQSVRESKREQLRVQIKAAVEPVHSAVLAHASARALAGFKDSLQAATGGANGSAAKFAESSRECSTQALQRWEDCAKCMDLADLGLRVEAQVAAFRDEVEKHVAELRDAKIQQVMRDGEEALVSAVEGPVLALLEAGSPTAWPQIREVYAMEAAAAREDLDAALAGFEMGVDELDALRGELDSAGRRAVEARTKASAQRALPLMKERFTSAFMNDAQGMPRRWSPSSDLRGVTHHARQQALQVLAAVAASQLDEGESEAGGTNPILARLMPLLGDQPDGAEAGAVGDGPGEREGGAKPLQKLRSMHQRTWDEVPAAKVFLSPADCRELWGRFKQETLYLVQQAQQQQEASGTHSWLPPMWAIVAMLVLGFNEIMALLRNPMLLLLAAAVFFFGRAVWRQVDGEDIFQAGLVPGLLALSSRVIPAVLNVFRQLVEAGQGQVRNFQEAHAHPHAHVHAHAHGPARPLEDFPPAHGAAGSSAHPRAGGQELRRRPGAMSNGDAAGSKDSVQ